MSTKSGLAGIGESLAGGASAVKDGVPSTWTNDDNTEITGIRIEGRPAIDVLDVNLSNTDAFFRFDTIELQDFNKMFSYSFVIYDTKKSQVLASCYFPIPPQSISISTTSASTITATMKGMVEDNNGAPFREISIQGTTTVGWQPGVMTSKAVAGGSLQDALQDNLEYAFASTIQAGKALAQQVGKMISTFSGGDATPPDNPPLNELAPTAKERSQAINSGYAFFHSLARFMDYYIALKKTKQGKDVRLVWHMFKDKMYYDVLLRNFTFTKPPGTTEYQYRIQLTAYMRREKPAGISRSSVNFLQPEDIATPPMLARILNGLNEVAATIDGFSNIFRGMKGDFDRIILGPIRAATAIVTAINGIEVAAEGARRASTSESLKRLRSAQANAIAKRGRASGGELESMGIGISRKDEELVPLVDLTKPLLVKWRNQADLMLAISEYFNTTDPEARKVLKERIEALTVLVYGQDAIVDLDSATAGGAAFKITVPSIEGEPPEIVNQLLAIAAPITDDDKLPESAYGEDTIAEVLATMGQRSPPDDEMTVAEVLVNSTSTVSDPELIKGQDALNKLGMIYNNLIGMYDQLFETPNKTYTDYYANTAVSAGLDFTKPRSKFMAPFEYGSSLQAMAVRYLGDADRWMEIASVNALKAPYVDEIGFGKRLIASGSGNIISVSDSENLNIGQIITLKSVSQPSEARRIENIDIIDSTRSLIRLDGKSNLSRFTVKDFSVLHSFLPGTVNSSKLIAIPSDSPVTTPREKEYRMSPNAQDLDQFAKSAKVDFLLTNEGDLVMGGGDVKLAIGMQNLTQALMIKLYTPRGSLVNDPTFGNPLTAGINVADLNTTQLINVLDQMIGADPRFGGILAARVNVQGPVGRIELAVNVKGTGYYLPVSAEGNF